MRNGSIGGGKSNSLLNDYALMLGDAVLRHRTHVAEQSARIEAELASRVKSEFIANMSHELRTPLNTIIGFSKFLGEHDRRRMKDEDIVEYARLIHDAAEHLLAVINDILDISKIQSGKFNLDTREVNLEEIVAACISSFGLAAREAKVDLTSRIDASAVTVRADAVKLRQILTNLVSNAIKFTREGGSVSVDVTLRQSWTAICVRDTGVGMSEEEILIALTPFGQVDASRSRWREGTGLGLPIAKSLAELHGGKLEIHSAKGEGTEVTVLLPPPRQRVNIGRGRSVMVETTAPTAAQPSL